MSPLYKAFTFRIVPLLGASAVALVLAGCSANFGNVAGSGIDSSASAGVALKGSAHGGQQPVTGATIQLWSVGTTGYGSNATALLTTSVTTDNNGGFLIPTTSYTCPANSYVYLTATGGNPGIGAGGSNAAIAELVALGPCANLSANTFINISETTTVAAVWAMAQFGSSTGTALSSSATTPNDTFGTSATNIQGIANAMDIAQILANTTTGTSPGTNTTGNQYNVEYWHINTLADILASCVNSAGNTGTTSNCGTLFANTNSATDTLQAALYMAKNPASNVAALAALSSPTAPFQPTDTTVNDFTVGLSYQTGTSATRWIAMDQFGNAWVATGGTNIYELSPTGNIIATPTTYSVGGTATPFKNSYEVAVDTANNAWFVDQSGTAGAIVEVTGSTSAGGANGTATGTSVVNTYTSAATPPVTSTPTVDGIGIDGKNNIWYAGSSSAIFELASGAYSTVVQGSATTASPFSLVVDLSNNPNSPNNVASGGASFVYAMNSGGCTGKAIAGATGTEGSLDMVYTATVGSSTPASATPVNYIADTGCGTTSKVALNSQNDNLSSLPYGLAVDNGNNLWIVNQNYVSADTSSAQYSLTKATPNYSTAAFTAANINSDLTFVNYSGGGLKAPFYLIMDGASAAWTANSTGVTAATATAGAVPQGSLSAFTNSGTALSPTTGFFGGVYTVNNGTVTTTYKRVIASARGIVVDPSGNVWNANTATFTPNGATSAIGFVTVTVGAATPAVTPLATGVRNFTLGSKP